MKKLFSAVAVALLASCTTLASHGAWNTDLSRALSLAKAENKMTFLLLGSEDCGICQHTLQLVNKGQVPVTQESFVFADLNTNDPRTDEEFLAKYGRDNFGDTLPFVVITDSKGKVLAHYSGYKSAAELTALVNQAKAKLK